MAESAPLSQSQKSGGRKLLMSRNRLFVADLYKARPMLAVRRFFPPTTSITSVASLPSLPYILHTGYVVSVAFIITITVTSTWLTLRHRALFRSLRSSTAARKQLPYGVLTALTGSHRCLHDLRFCPLFVDCSLRIKTTWHHSLSRSSI